MAILIGGFSPQQYRSYVLPNLKKEGNAHKHHSVTHFHLFSFSAIAVLVNRIAYFLLHRFTIYPNNSYLFKKFKSHEFSKIQTKSHYETVEKIFTLFERCSDLNSEAMKKVKAELDAVEKLLKKREDICIEETSVDTETVGEAESEENEIFDPEEEILASETDDSSHSSLFPDEVSNFIDESYQPNDPFLSDENEYQEQEFDPSDFDSSETNSDHSLQDVEERVKAKMVGDESLPEEESEDEKVGSDSDQPAAEVLNSSLNPHFVIVDENHEPNPEKLSDEGESGGLNSDSSETDGESDDQIPKKCSEDSVIDHGLSLTGKSPSVRFEEEKQQIFEEGPLVKEQEDLFIPLPKEIKEYIDKGFPLSREESINELNKNDFNSLERCRCYARQLRAMLRFQHKLAVEESKTTDSRFEDYMKKFNDAFQKAWSEIDEQIVNNLHHKFNKAFPNEKIEVLRNGYLNCTANQFQWVLKKIANTFPAIYHLAFDAPSLRILQKTQINSLARMILVGPDADKKGPKIKSGCFILLKETVEKATPALTFDSEFNPLIEKGSFILTHFLGPNGKLPKHGDDFKDQLKELAGSYVKDWLKRKGAVLRFGESSIFSGQSSRPIPAADWVARVRDAYTATLMAMDGDRLKEEIQKNYTCPFIKLVVEAYLGDVEEAEWEKSKFPKVLLEELFKDEFKKASGDSYLEQSMRKTIDDASFQNESDISMLAQKAKVSESIVESLIRIRVFYMMVCFGQNMTEPVVRDLNKRAKTMYDPSICKTAEDSALVCYSSGERALHFNETFDALTIKVKTEFKDPNTAHVVAECHSVMTVSSISQSQENEVQVRITELENLNFSLYSSPAQMRYLVAQIDPQTLHSNIEKLNKDVFALKISEKARKYQDEKKTHENDRSIIDKTWKLNLFNPLKYQSSVEDAKLLDAALERAKVFVTYLNTQSILLYTGQIHSDIHSDEEDLDKNIDDEIIYIKGGFQSIFDFLREVYSSVETEDHTTRLIFQKSKKLKELLLGDHPGLSQSDLEGEASANDLMTSVSEDKSEREKIIGKNAGSIERGMFQKAWNRTLGLYLSETTDVKCLTWKIKRYEDLIRGNQLSISKYIESLEGFGGIEQLLKDSDPTTAPEWMCQIHPILEFCTDELRDDDARLNPEYLEAVRKSYTNDLLSKLRNAAKWAKSHPSMPGVEHINAICHQLYTALNLNDCCQNVFDTFLDLGEEIGCHPSDTSLGDPLYQMIASLEDDHHKIQAVPSQAKAPMLDKAFNSLRGHFNGFRWITSFDPNMQSNPIHFFFNKLIKRRQDVHQVDVHQVKDIAMGSPTIEIGDGEVEIAPEFEGVLRHYQKNGLVHLYVNNQAYSATSLIKGCEVNRCEALHALAEKHFKETLYVITLDQNTSFYQQKSEIIQASYDPRKEVEKVKKALIQDVLEGESRDYLPAHFMESPRQELLKTWMEDEVNRIHIEDFSDCAQFQNKEARELFTQCFHKSLRLHIENVLDAFSFGNCERFGYSPYYPVAKDFKKELLVRIFDGDSRKTGNCIPADLVTKFDLKNWSEEAVNGIHQALFGDRADLTIDERRIFIRLFYQNLSRKILIETRADSYNASCKDRIDRGAATDAEDYAYLAILANCMNQPEVIAFFRMLVFSRAIIVRKRTIIEERLERLIETVKFMLDHQEGLKTLQARLFPEIEITIDQFGLEPLG